MAMLQAATSVIGGVVGAMGAMQQAEAQAQAAEYNAQVAERNRRVIKDQTGAALEDQAKENFRKMREIRASYGANNIDLQGSALDVVLDTAIEQRLAKRRIRYRGQLAMLEQEDEANLQRMGAASARAAGGISAISSILGGLGGAVSAGIGAGWGGGGSAASAPAAGTPAPGIPNPRPRPSPSIPPGAGGH
jgi:hypothetical protein